MVHGYPKNIAILVLVIIAAGANVGYDHGEFHAQFMGLTSFTEILKDGLGSGVATVIGWFFMRSPERTDDDDD